MNPLQWTFLSAALLASALPTAAQQHRASPHETNSTVIDGSRLTIVYGRPYSKNPHGGEVRKIWGSLVPFGKVWRLGADEATLLITQKPLVFGETTVPAGAYTLFMLPEDSGESKLIINKQIGQWGTQYNEAEDLARIPLKKSSTDKAADQLTVAVEKNSSGGGVLKIMWETTEFAVPFTIGK